MWPDKGFIHEKKMSRIRAMKDRLWGFLGVGWVVGVSDRVGRCLLLMRLSCKSIG